MITYNDLRQPDYSFPSSNPLFFRLGTLKIHEIFKLKVAKFIFKCLEKKVPINFHHWFQLTSQMYQYHTRSSYTNNYQDSKHLYMPFARTTNYGSKKIKIQGTRIWNSLPVPLRITQSLSYFSINLKKILLNNYQ